MVLTFLFLPTFKHLSLINVHASAQRLKLYSIIKPSDDFKWLIQMFAKKVNIFKLKNNLSIQVYSWDKKKN